MSPSEYEPTLPRLIAPTQSFFTDIYTDRLSQQSMLLDAEKLLLGLGIGLNSGQAMAEIAQHVPLYNDVSYDDAAMLDIYLTLPLKTVAPHIEAHNDLRTIRDWYDLVIPKMIVIAEHQGHSVDCLQSTHFAVTMNNSCPHGPYCPVIVLTKHLEHDLFDMDQDFDDQKYADDPEMARDIALLKAEFTIKYKLREPKPIEGFSDDEQTLVDQYVNKLHQKFPISS